MASFSRQRREPCGERAPPLPQIKFTPELAVRFDVQLGESFYHKSFASVTDELLRAGVAVRDPDNSVVAKFENMPPLVLMKSDGATLYGIRDLATAKYRREKNFGPTGTLLTTTGHSYASYLLGALNAPTITEDNVVENGGRFRNYSWWASDDFKVTPRLTLRGFSTEIS